MVKQFDLNFFENEIKPLLNNHEAKNWSLEFERGVNSYLERLNRVGLNIDGDVLDAGGGAGNWAIPLSMVNNHVELVDVADGRLLIAQKMINHLAIQNITIRNMSIEETIYPNNHFDAVVCYSVIMFTNVKKTLCEFRRILKPGGKLFIQADLWRWYFGQGTPKYANKVNYVIKLILKKIFFGKPVFLTQRSFKLMLERSGFELLGVGQDGETSFDLDSKCGSSESFYEPRKIGKEEIIEVCAIKH